ncbi:MAG: hypothetical protein U0166_07860 [Acidobacteriota bacterium]
MIRAAHNAYGNGWGLIKLYFAIGLPTETIDDVEAIVDPGTRVSAIGKEGTASAREVNLRGVLVRPQAYYALPVAPDDAAQELRHRQGPPLRSPRAGRRCA